MRRVSGAACPPRCPRRLHWHHTGVAVPGTEPFSCVAVATDYAMGKDCIVHGYMSKLGNPFLTQWQRRYFYLFPNRLEWRGEGESPVRWARGGRGVQLLGLGLSLSPQQSLLTMEEIDSV